MTTAVKEKEWSVESLAVRHEFEVPARDCFRKVARMATDRMKEVYESLYGETLSISELVLKSNPQGVSYYYRKEDVEDDNPFFGCSKSYTEARQDPISGDEHPHVVMDVTWRVG
jgi:hypothetical protein